jgi:hypothetical protein
VNPEVPTHHVHDGDLQLYVLGRLSAAEVDVLEGHLFDCVECMHRLSNTAAFVAKIFNLQRDDGTNKRAEPRFRTSDPVFLRSLAPARPDRWPVVIVDVSKNGLGLIVPIRLSPGDMVQVQSGGTFALGEVRYSRQITEGQFQTGIRLQDVTAPPVLRSRSAPPHRA